MKNLKIFLSYFFGQNSKNLLSRLKSKKNFTMRKVYKFDFKQYRLLKFSKSPILKLSGVLHTFEGGDGRGVPSRRLGNCQEFDGFHEFFTIFFRSKILESKSRNKCHSYNFLIRTHKKVQAKIRLFK